MFQVWRQKEVSIIIWAAPPGCAASVAGDPASTYIDIYAKCRWTYIEPYRYNYVCSDMAIRTYSDARTARSPDI